jgi:hypothetical protein
MSGRQTGFAAEAFAAKSATEDLGLRKACVAGAKHLLPTGNYTGSRACLRWKEPVVADVASLLAAVGAVVADVIRVE